LAAYSSGIEKYFEQVQIVDEMGRVTDLKVSDLSGGHAPEAGYACTLASDKNQTNYWILRRRWSQSSSS
jgi:hypothetical protein